MIQQSVSTPRLPRRTLLTPNLHRGRQDLSNPKARTSADHQSKRSARYKETRRARYEETRRGNVDYRIKGIPHSTVQREDSNRKEIVKRLIQKFETHPNRRSSTTSARSYCVCVGGEFSLPNTAKLPLMKEHCIRKKYVWKHITPQTFVRRL